MRPCFGKRLTTRPGTHRLGTVSHLIQLKSIIILTLQARNLRLRRLNNIPSQFPSQSVTESEIKPNLCGTKPVFFLLHHTADHGRGESMTLARRLGKSATGQGTSLCPGNTTQGNPSCSNEETLIKILLTELWVELRESTRDIKMPRD